MSDFNIVMNTVEDYTEGRKTPIIEIESNSTHCTKSPVNVNNFIDNIPEYNMPQFNINNYSHNFNANFKYYDENVFWFFIKINNFEEFMENKMPFESEELSFTFLNMTYKLFAKVSLIPMEDEGLAYKIQFREDMKYTGKDIEDNTSENGTNKPGAANNSKLINFSVKEIIRKIT